MSSCFYVIGYESNHVVVTRVLGARVEAPITYHLRVFALDLEKYKVVQNYPV